MKKIMFGLIFLLLARTICTAQNGLESITVEKYYVSNAADAAGSVGTLPVGSVTYRVYADMLPGYNLQAVYGVPGHTLLLNSSTSFFNNEDYGSTTPTGISVNNSRKNSVMIDSWFSMGGNASGKVAVLKTEDSDGALVNNTAPLILQNADPSAGIAINVADGMINGSAPSVTFVGLNNTGNGDLGVFDGTSQVGGSFNTANGSVAVLGGVVGPTVANRVLIGQFTTDGVFNFELNVQIGTPTGGTQNFVASSPVGSEITIPSLTQTLGAPNVAPTVNISSPTNGAGFITGSNVSIAATAGDIDGTVDSVAFYVDGIFLSKDINSPYTANYTAVTGSHCITARATDNNGAQTTTVCTNINVASNPPPTLNITAPANGASVKSNVLLNIAATATDNTGVDSVSFYYDGVFISKDLVSTYAAVYTPTATGSHTILARAVDTQGAASTASVVINVINNLPPTVSLTAPANGAVFTFPAVVAITANANDADGTVDSVEFYVNNVKVGVDKTLPSPFTFNWTSVIGPANLTAKAYDDNGAVTTSALRSITIADPNALPYKIASINNTCNGSGFCLPLVANDTVRNIIGYDVVLQYNKNKVTPTGSITVDNALINPSYVNVINSIDAVNGLITISAFFNSTAPANANFNGKGNVFCVGFNKTATFNSVDTAAFALVSLQESYFTGVVTRLADAGKFITYRDSIFNGSLKFWIDNSPIKYDAANPARYLVTNIYGTDVSCGNQSLTVTQPDTNGIFQYVISNGVNVSIQKDILGSTDVQPVINGMDALLVTKVLLNDVTFTPTVYQAIAADVNLDGAISSGDVSQINQRTVLMIPEFKQAWNYNAQGQSNGQASKDWMFVDSITLATNPAYLISATYPLNDGVGFSKARVPAVPFCLPIPVTTTDCPVITPESFKGVLFGDVNGNYSTTSPNGLFRNANDKVVFDLSKAIASNGYLDIPVSIASKDDVNALDFAMKFNETSLAFNSILNQAGYMKSLSKFNEDDRTLRFTSYSQQTYDANNKVASIRFATNGAQITEADFNSVTAYLNGEKVGIEFTASTSSVTSTNVIVNVYPNPANEIVNLTVSEDANVELLSIDGKIVVIKTNVNANQKLEINTQAIANGVYMMKVYNDNFVSMKKVVIRK